MRIDFNHFIKHYNQEKIHILALVGRDITISTGNIEYQKLLTFFYNSFTYNQQVRFIIFSFDAFAIH